MELIYLNFFFLSSISALITIIKRIVKEIDNDKEHPTNMRHIPIVYISPPNTSLRYFNTILILVPIKLQFIKENTPPFFLYIYLFCY